MHAMWLESGSAIALQEYCNSFVSTTSDLGTEFAIADIADTPIKSVLPWAQLPEQELQIIAGDDLDLEDIPEEGFEPADDPSFEVGLGASIAVTGLLHILHNAGNELTSACESLPDTVEQMKQVAKLLASPSSNDRLRSTCFGSALARPFDAQLRRYSGKVYEARWGSVAWSAQELLKLERPPGATGQQ